MILHWTKTKKNLHFFNLEGGLLEKHHLVLTTHKKIISPRPPSSSLREEERFRGIWEGGGGKIKFREGNMSKYHACCWGELFWRRLDIFFYLWRREMRSDGVKPIASLFKIRTPNNCGNIDDKARQGNCSERVWLKAHVRKAEAIKGLVYFKSKEDMLRAW